MTEEELKKHIDDQMLELLLKKWPPYDPNSEQEPFWLLKKVVEDLVESNHKAYGKPFIRFVKWGVYGRFKSGRGGSILLNRMRLFSERNGYKKVYRFGPIAIEFYKGW